MAAARAHSGSARRSATASATRQHDKRGGSHVAPAPVEIVVRLSGVQYTDRTAVDTVTQVFDRAGVNYKSVELASGKAAPKTTKGKKTTKKATAKKTTAAKSTARRKKTTARRKADRTGKTSRRRG